MRHVPACSLSDWSFDEDEPGAYDATLAKLNGPELEEERTVEVRGRVGGRGQQGLAGLFR